MHEAPTSENDEHNSRCLTSAPTGQFFEFEQRRVSGSSKPLWSEDEREIPNIEGRC